MKKGFTLLEILIASTIFAMVMLFAVGAFGMGSNYSGKMKEMRKVNEGSRRLADMITSDIRSANAPGEITYAGADPMNPVVLSFKNGIALAICNQNKCDPDQNVSPTNTNIVSSSNNLSNAIIIFNKDRVKVYCAHKSTSSNRFKLYYKELSAGPIDLTDPSTIFPDNNVINKSISDNDTEIKLFFNGFAPDDIHANLQPYINFFIEIRTASDSLLFDQMPVYKRHSTEIKSTVTSRSFNQ